MAKNQEIRNRVFLDTNIIISGTFFRGNEAKLLSIPDIVFYTCDIVIEEMKEVVNKKFRSLKIESKRVALLELERASMDFVILREQEYLHNVARARKLISKDKDAKILAAILTVCPDCFVTGDTDFYTDEIRSLVPVIRTRDFLETLKVN